MTAPERDLLYLLVTAGLPWSLALRVVLWRREHPNRHIGEAGSRLLASLLLRGGRT